MSERTTIGGTVYETLGSSSSNLLLRCNGTARIQWGNKLIDLIKNGKIVSSGNSVGIYVIDDESELNHDGLYILNVEKEDDPQLLIYKEKQKYNLTGTDLYISASKKQDITSDQQKQALENLKVYFNTVEELQNSGIQNGIAYVTDTQQLYTIQDGLVNEFRAKLQAVEVEEESEDGEIINSSYKIVLSVSESDYITLQDSSVYFNANVHIAPANQIGSTDADEFQGYRLYMTGDTSCLEVDQIVVRHGLPIQEYIESTCRDFRIAMISSQLEPNKWYLLKDYQNPWKIAANDMSNNRPILVQASSQNTIHPEGCLFKDRGVRLTYDPSYIEDIYIVDSTFDEGGNLVSETVTTNTVETKGKITWMRDSNGNESNFDFLDYKDRLGNALTDLHINVNNPNLDASIFPKNSYNNKIFFYNLYGTVINNGVVDNSQTYTIHIKIDDSKNEEDFYQDNEDGSVTITGTPQRMIMHDNTILDCRGITLESTCLEFSNNYLNNVTDCVVHQKFNNNKIKNLTQNKFIKDFCDNTMDTLQNNTFNNTCSNNRILNMSDCVLNCELKDSNFKYLFSCVFNGSLIQKITGISTLRDLIIDENSYPFMYNASDYKDVCISDGSLKEFNIITEVESIPRYTVMMFAQKDADIPEGWAICDGKTYEYKGVESKTPDLKDKFIKGVTDTKDIGTEQELDATETDSLWQATKIETYTLVYIMKL